MCKNTSNLVAVNSNNQESPENNHPIPVMVPFYSGDRPAQRTHRYADREVLQETLSEMYQRSRPAQHVNRPPRRKNLPANFPVNFSGVLQREHSRSVTPRLQKSSACHRIPRAFPRPAFSADSAQSLCLSQPHRPVNLCRQNVPALPLNHRSEGRHYCDGIYP